jgi:hypothetical protein
MSIAASYNSAMSREAAAASRARRSRRAGDHAGPSIGVRTAVRSSCSDVRSSGSGSVTRGLCVDICRHHLQSLFEEQFFEWVCRHAKKIVADPAYQRLKQLEQASEAACRTEAVDAGMEDVALAWNAIPGVAVSSSCQGASGVVTYAGRMLLVPSVHDECAYVTVALNDESLAEAIERCRSPFPYIRSTLFSRPVGSYRGFNQRYCQLRSVAAMDNARVCEDLVTIALGVRAQLL